MAHTLSLEMITSWLRTAWQSNHLPPAITQEMLGDLVQALVPTIERYAVKEGQAPTPPVFLRIANNFALDGLKVQALLAAHEHDPAGLWQQLQKNLLGRARRKWPRLAEADLEEIVMEAWVRIHRYLPGFLFLARFSTWADMILYNRERNWWSKNEERLRREISLDQPLGAGNEPEAPDLGDTLADGAHLLEDQMSRQQLVEQIWQRLAMLGNELDVQVLRLLYGDGYKQTEIAEMLHLSNAKITRHKQRMYERIANDQEIHSLVEQLGFTPTQASTYSVEKM